MNSLWVSQTNTITWTLTLRAISLLYLGGGGGGGEKKFFQQKGGGFVGGGGGGGGGGGANKFLQLKREDLLEREGGLIYSV